MFGGRIGRFLDADIEDWCLETWAWLLSHLGGMERFRGLPLVTPSRGFFPSTVAEGHERAMHVFTCVKVLMGMQDWWCALEPYARPEAHAKVGEFWVLQSDNRAPNGTFRAGGGEVTISYASDLLQRPADLVATLAHELSHYLLASLPGPAPGGHELHELTTDLTVAFCGFGIFGANHAFSFEQHGDAFSKGWRSRGSGYLSERTWAFALALFLALKEQEGAADTWIKPSVKALVKDASRYLKRRPELLAPLRAI
jgi:hypothetical protein